MAWTPDSRHVLFVKFKQGESDMLSELWRISAEGGQPERVDEFPSALGYQVEHLRVHPDGRQIAFQTRYAVSIGMTGMLQIVGPDESAEETRTRTGSGRTRAFDILPRNSSG